MRRFLLFIVLTVLVQMFSDQDILAQQAPQGTPPVSTQESDVGYALSTNKKRIVREDYPTSGVVLGQGWDRFLARKQQAVCVTGKASELGGRSITLKINRVEDIEDIFTHLRVSVSAKINSGVASYDGSASFARDIKVDTSALNILASVIVDTGGRHLEPSIDAKPAQAIEGGEVELTKEALEALKSGQVNFQKLCGDSFVVAIREGGRLDAILQLRTSSRAEKRDIEAELKGKGLWGNAEAKINSNLDAKRKTNDFKYEYNQQGGNIESTPLDADALVSKMKEFGKSEGFSSKPYEIYLLDYSNIFAFERAASAAKLKDIVTPEELDLWANHYWRLINYYSELQEALQNQKDYLFISFDPDDPFTDALGFSSFVVNTASAIDRVLQKCASERRQCDFKTALNLTLGEVRKIQVNQKVDVYNDYLKVAFGKSSIIEATTQGVSRSVTITKEDSILETPFDWYYYWLGKKPVLSGKNGKVAQLTIEQLKATQDEFKSLSSPTDDKVIEISRKKFQTWLLRERFLPLSAEFCGISASHKMCLTPSRLQQIASMVPFLIPAKHLEPDAVPPDPPEIKIPTPVPQPECKHSGKGNSELCP